MSSSCLRSTSPQGQVPVFFRLSVHGGYLLPDMHVTYAVAHDKPCCVILWAEYAGLHGSNGFLQKVLETPSHHMIMAALLLQSEHANTYLPCCCISGLSGIPQWRGKGGGGVESAPKAGDGSHFQAHHTSRAAFRHPFCLQRRLCDHTRQLTNGGSFSSSCHHHRF